MHKQGQIYGRWLSGHSLVRVQWPYHHDNDDGDVDGVLWGLEGVNYASVHPNEV